MITVRIEFFDDKERTEFLNALQSDYDFVEVDKIKDTKKVGSKQRLQFIKIAKKHENGISKR